MAFSPGDIVQLKSGGPPMTVVTDEPDGIHCLWYGGAADDLRRGVIPAVCLEGLVVDPDAVGSEEPTAMAPPIGSIGSL